MYEVKLQKSCIFASSVHRYHKSYFQLIWPFYDFLQLYEVKLQKSHFSVSLVHKYHKCCSELIWPFYGLLQQLWGKTSLISYLRHFSAQVSQIVFSAHFNRFPASCNCMSEKFKNLISPGVKCTSVTSRVLSSFDRFTAYYKCMRKNFKNLISPWVQCTSITKSCFQIIWPSHGLFQLYEIKLKKTSWVQCRSITNRFLSFHDRFTDFYNCMRKNFKNLISPGVQCKSITNRLLSSFDRFLASYNFMR